MDLAEGSLQCHHDNKQCLTVISHLDANCQILPTVSWVSLKAAVAQKSVLQDQITAREKERGKLKDEALKDKKMR